MNNTPKVTVLMPTYNGSETILDAVKSVLEQSYKDFEFLIIDDGSSDNTADVVLSVGDDRIRYLKNESNLGIQKSLNRGIREAQGKYIARIDDDDEWLDKGKLKKQISFLQLNPDHVLIGTGAVIADENGKEIFRFFKPTKDSNIRKIILGKNCFLHPSVVYKKRSVEEVGLYDESKDCLHVEDRDLWLKLGRVGKLANLKMYGIKHIKSEDQISSKNRMKQLKGSFGLIEKYKDDYPGYYKALARSSVRFVLYGLFNYGKIKYSSPQKK